MNEFLTMELLGYFAAFIMGLTLGAIGSGGSILTVPILVYLIGVNPVLATGYSLLIVGAAAALGAYRSYKKGLVDIKPTITFAIPSIIAVYVTRAFLMPAIPDPITLSKYEIDKGAVIMVLFSGLMILSAMMMMRNSRKETIPARSSHHHSGLIFLEGALVGVATGILGAGGGFLIIPALVLLMGMDMKKAVGASLLIIALKSLIGFMGDIQSGIEFQMPMLAFFFAATFAGMFSAPLVSNKLDEKKLQQVFACFTFLVALIVIFKELT